ncbi:MAG: lactate racemase domain-containing protein [Planctomycetaceae bacterium]|nr:lactate racemase domain-containing protein [Planctomycetaceae bacterium]
MNLIGQGQPDAALTGEQIETIVARLADRIAADGKRILVLIPDQTRSCPLGLIVRLLHKHIANRADKLDFLIALGTHQPLDEARIDSLLGMAGGQRDRLLSGSSVFNHDWKNPGALKTIGRLTADRVAEITGGRFSMDVDVTINRRVFDYDLVLVAGPVFPHEVAGFSGGEKYFFPGICGQELLDFFHWLGAVITCPRVIGVKDTPVRRTLQAAGEMLPVPTAALSMVVAPLCDTGKMGATHNSVVRVPDLQGQRSGSMGETPMPQLTGLFAGSLRDSWSAAADLSAKVHIRYVQTPYQSVLARAPEMYDDLWVAAKCMYKMEPVMADGGELIIFAPHVKEISYTHGHIIRKIGYHTLEYFLAQWDRFKDYPWGVLAHSTHVKGIGTYDTAGHESPRIRVTLATGIDEATCRAVNLGYRDPATINPAHWQDRPGHLYIPKAGETLYRLKNPPAWQTF